MNVFNVSHLSIALLVILSSTASAQTMFFPEADTQILQQWEYYDPPHFYGDSSGLGVGSHGPTGRHRTLMSFDLAPLTGQTVTAASLTLFRAGGDLSFTNQIVSIFEVAQQNGDWTESNSAWAWKDYRRTRWAGANGLGSSGLDFNDAALGSAIVSSTDAVWAPITFTLNPAGIAVLQRWIDSPELNAGLLIRADGLEASSGGVAQFTASEYPDNDRRPRLDIATVPEPSAAAFLALVFVLTGTSRTCFRDSPQ